MVAEVAVLVVVAVVVVVVVLVVVVVVVVAAVLVVAVVVVVPACFASVRYTVEEGTAGLHNRLVCRHDIDHVINDEHNRTIIVVLAKTK
jgi:hypothetical protein